MKWIHNDKVSLGWAIFVELVVHALFAFQAFLLGGFLGEIALNPILGSSGAKIGAWALAIFIFGAAFQAFVLGEYMREHVESFEATSKGNGSYIRSWQQVRWLVAGLEISSLAFRCLTVFMQGDVRQAVIVAVFGAIALWYAFAQAKVIHASVNRPVEYDVSRARDSAGKDLVRQAIKLIPGMSAERKRRVYTGDLSAITEEEMSHTDKRNQKLQIKEEKRNKEQERKRQQEESYRTGQNYTRKLLGGDEREERWANGDDPKLEPLFNQAQNNPGHHLSESNGNRK